MNMQKTALIAIIITLFPLATVFVIFLSMEPINIRLPTNIWPSGYNLTIEPHLYKEKGQSQYKFNGEVWVRIQPIRRTKIIVLHSKDLHYTLSEYYAEDNPQLRKKLLIFHRYPKTDRIKYTLNRYLEAYKNYTLHFKYIGFINDKCRGIFREEYEDSNNVTNWLLATLFEPTEARRVFPCFDEPKFKATFTLTIVKPRNMTAYSNTKLACSQIRRNHTIDTFAPTPIMSTYLLAFLITTFKERKDGRFGVIANPEKYALTKYSFNLGRETIAALDAYLGLNYYELGVNKLQLAAIPNINYGGMENWGLVICQDSQILHDNSSMQQQKETLELLAHEMAHMWFGNLVTCDWWSYIWLNEAFATYFTYFIPNMLKPNFMFEKWFFKEQLQSSLSIDVTDDVHALNIETTTDLSRRNLFGSITYMKGASFVHMVKHIIGEKYFQTSLNEYLRTYQYRTVTPKSLLNIWRNYWPTVFIEFLDDFFSSYTEQKGYPLITINVACDNQSFKIKQQRFVADANAKVDLTLQYTVPITYTTDLEMDFVRTYPKFFLCNTHAIVQRNLAPNTKWIIANVQATGYYRVNYNKENWQHITVALKASNWSGIPELNRAQIVDDIHHLASAGWIGFDLALQVLAYLETETEYLPWRMALNGFEQLAKRLGPNMEQFQFYIQKLSRKAFETLGFESKPTDTLFDIHNRQQLLPWSCKYGNPACIAQAHLYYNDKQAYSALSPEARFVVYCTIVRETNETIYYQLLHQYHSTGQNQNERRFIMNALSCVKSHDLVEQHFHHIINSNLQQYEKLQAVKSLFSENTENSYHFFKLIKSNYKYLAKIFSDDNVLSKIIAKVSAYFTSDKQLQDLISFNNFLKSTQSKNDPNIMQRAIDSLKNELKRFRNKKTEFDRGFSTLN